MTGTAGQSVFVDDADFVTSLAWAPDGRLFFAERGGAIKVARGGKVTTFATVPTVTTERGGGYSERGLLGLALSPTFATDHFVYAFYSAQRLLDAGRRALRRLRGHRERAHHPALRFRRDPAAATRVAGWCSGPTASSS